MIAIYLMLTLIFTALLCIVKEIGEIAKVVEKYGKDGGKDV